MAAAVKFPPARPTMYAGIQMRSRLEAEAARQFDLREWRWTYEPLAYADRSGTYLPDFEIHGRHPRRSFVEVKPLSFFRDQAEITRLQKRMQVILTSLDYCAVDLIIYEPESNIGFVLERDFVDSELEWFDRGPLFVTLPG